MFDQRENRKLIVCEQRSGLGNVDKRDGPYKKECEKEGPLKFQSQVYSRGISSEDFSLVWEED